MFVPTAPKPLEEPFVVQPFLKMKRFEPELLSALISTFRHLLSCTLALCVSLCFVAAAAEVADPAWPFFLLADRYFVDCSPPKFSVTLLTAAPPFAEWTAVTGL